MGNEEIFVKYKALLQGFAKAIYYMVALFFSHLPRL